MKKPTKNSCLPLIALLAFMGTSPLAFSDPNGNNGHGNGNKHNNKEFKGNNGHKNKDDDHYKAKQWDGDNSGIQGTLRISPNISFSVNFGNVRPLAIEYGLTGYKGLPPGIAKQVRRGKPLPPGIAKKVLPSKFIHQLPVYAGYEWKMSGKDLILVAIGTAVVAEIIENVFE
ncbi:anti-virulence regulator CigR family protein [Providencia sp. JUb39]|uniref:anti-virulence regulator CigR family protein n=1 Tax=Providencia sp. JUb39 TaxID=2724165 RepID=UPI00164D2AB9|nr:anti-virulence regulator CigR family protein [Providencia sp. JUb39]MBC5790910.1 hypothetical protein [Providencia sp. JUb39]